MKIMSASFLGLALMVSIAATSDGNEEAVAAIARTRDTRADFIVVSDVRVAFEDMAPMEFVGAEFHSGPFHRLEDPNFRVVADCKSRIGYHLTVAENRITSGPDVADSQCGIAPFPAGAKIRFLGRIATKFGEASRIEVDEPVYNRSYDVLESGAIVRNVWRSKAPEGLIVYQSVATAYCAVPLPESAFTRESLAQTFLTSEC